MNWLRNKQRGGINAGYIVRRKSLIEANVYTRTMNMYVKTEIDDAI